MTTKLFYKVSIDDPKNHIAKVRIEGQRKDNESFVEVYMPSWCPGSYLMREYGRQVRTFKASAASGERLFHEQVDKGTWRIDWDRLKVKSKEPSFTIEYEVYCHELTVRTPHIDESHAFLHGSSVFMAIVGSEDKTIELELSFPPLWSKVSTGLVDVSKVREKFVYSATDYDELIDCPIEIGCHETDGFSVAGKDHHIAFYGEQFPHKNKIKEDMKTIVEHISQTMGEIPYDFYLFLTHLVPNLYGGLEHRNSTALIFDGRKFADRKSYLGWLCLVSHEYFHTWNVKRIRPKDFGPFDYRTEADTKLLWLAEGLTSFVDELFVYRCGLATLEEYLEMQATNLDKYLSHPGRYFHSLEDSAFNAWNKLYKADENYANSSVSYYLKGGIVFFVLNILLHEKGKNVNHLLDSLWSRYKSDPENGMVDTEIYQMIEDLAGKKVREDFEMMIQSTQDIEFEKLYKKMGLEIEWEEKDGPFLGVTPEYRGDKVFLKSVLLSGPAFKSGLNAGDEILAVNGMRFSKKDMSEQDKIFLVDKSYEFLVSRLGSIIKVDVLIGKKPRKVKSLKALDQGLVDKVLKGE